MPHLFSLQSRVSQRLYAQVGFGLMLLKYFVEAAGLYFFTQQIYTPLDFFNPLLSARSRLAADAPAILGMTWVAWTIPFVWIALAMSLRRAVDAGKSPWLAMLILVPIVNLFVMLYLVILPAKESAASTDTTEQELNAIWAAPQTASVHVSANAPRSNALGVQSALFGILVGGAYAVGITVLTVYVFDSYGSVLFFGTPSVAGAASGYLYNRRGMQTVAATLGQSTLMMIACLCGLMLFALEGAICIVMAAPIMIPVAILGALVGRSVALQSAHNQTYQLRDDRGFMGCLLMLPLFGMVEPHFNAAPTYEVLSTVEIDAPIETVWNSVVSFPDIETPPPWYFRAGVSMPLRARIEGHGVGAIRHCEFTTGSFVEPITVWDEPNRLAFDVTEQPEPMYELTPYRHIHPPHLRGSFRSERGEFRLTTLDSGKTKLEGRTWYQLRIYPNDYWTIWTDWVVHRIHVRVLDHIKNVAENEEEWPSSNLSVGYLNSNDPTGTRS